MTLPTWQECAARGMTTAEAARARGTGAGNASHAARRLGLTFARHRSEPTRDDDEMLLHALQLKATGHTAKEVAAIVGYPNAASLSNRLNTILAEWRASE